MATKGKKHRGFWIYKRQCSCCCVCVCRWLCQIATMPLRSAFCLKSQLLFIRTSSVSCWLFYGSCFHENFWCTSARQNAADTDVASVEEDGVSIDNDVYRCVW